VLRQSARILREAARTQDMVCRLGGEEFLAICPETDTAAALQCAERIRKQFEAAIFQVENLKLRLTVSIGGASRNSAMPDFDNLLKVADQALTSPRKKAARVIFARKPAPGAHHDQAHRSEPLSRACSSMTSTAAGSTTFRIQHVPRQGRRRSEDRRLRRPRSVHRHRCRVDVAVDTEIHQESWPPLETPPPTRSR
jgi:hypothetical protein